MLGTLTRVWNPLSWEQPEVPQEGALAPLWGQSSKHQSRQRHQGLQRLIGTVCKQKDGKPLPASKFVSLILGHFIQFPASNLRRGTAVMKSLEDRRNDWGWMSQAVVSTHQLCLFCRNTCCEQHLRAHGYLFSLALGTKPHLPGSPSRTDPLCAACLDTCGNWPGGQRKTVHMAMSRKGNSGGMRTSQWAPLPGCSDARRGSRGAQILGALRRAALGPTVPLLLLRTTHRADGKIWIPGSSPRQADIPEGASGLWARPWDPLVLPGPPPVGMLIEKWPLWGIGCLSLLPWALLLSPNPTGSPSLFVCGR